MQRVLFVSRRGALRAPLAQAMFKHLAEAHAAGQLLAASAGMVPATTVDAYVVLSLRELGIHVAPHQPLAVSEAMTRHADRVIALGEHLHLPPDLGNVTDRWAVPELEQPTLQQVRALRDELQPRVATLVAEMLAVG